MSISRIIAGFLWLILPLAVLGQNANLNTAVRAATSDDTKEAPKLDHFDPNLVDKSLNPCDDFYKYACNKWIAANPIPADQVYWSTGGGLEMWNDSVLRETLEAASKNDSARGPVQQKIGDYWAACTDESGIEATGLTPLLPEFNRIAALKSKQEMTVEIAHLHHLFPGAWEQGDNQTDAPFFGFTGLQDY
ncbi:MAG: M13 family metallopeptidase N-terminal domain-containing protein, partial [Candidatus Sulfotelmatobacter sp.]